MIYCHLVLHGGSGMCESNVYMKRGDKEETVLEDVEILRPEGDMLYISNIYGEEKRLRARLVTVNFTEHKVVLAEE